jgi:acyl transferase domain-containing protein
MRSAVGTGLTALLGLPAEAVTAEIERRGAEVDLAAWNAPDATLVSGAASAVRGLVDDLSSAGTFARLLPGTIAFHSRFVGALPERLTARVDGLRPLDVEPLLISTVTGEAIAGSALTAEYWGRNLREPVRFQPAIERLAAAGYRTYIEVGAHPALLPSIKAVLGEGHRVLPTLRRGEPERTALLTAAADLYAAGVDLNWPAINGAATAARPALRFWSAARTRSGAAAAETPGAGAETDLAALVQAADDRPARITLVRDFICDELSRVLRIGRDRVDPDRSMALLGLDSIMGLELRRRLSATLGADVRVATLLRGATPGEVAAEVTDVLAATSPSPAAPEPVPVDDPEELDRLLDGLDDLSPAEVESLLDRLDSKGLA